MKRIRYKYCVSISSKLVCVCVCVCVHACVLRACAACVCYSSYIMHKEELCMLAKCGMMVK